MEGRRGGTRGERERERKRESEGERVVHEQAIFLSMR
jgi:hypothetical protein